MGLELLFVFVIVVIGGFIQGASGFGFGLVAMGFLPLFLTLKESTLIVIALLFVASLSIVRKMYQYIELKGLLLIILPAMAGRVFSFFILTAYGDMDVLKQVLGFFLIGMVIYLLLKKKASPSAEMKLVTPLVLGFLGGFIGGIFAVGGPFFVFYFLMLYQDKYKYNANLQVTVVITSLFTLLLHGLNGDFDVSLFGYILAGILGVFLGTALGLKWFENLPAAFIKNLAMIMVLLAAINLILFS
ncbi:sulfite exporter TauE/SafE family protein [Thalassorhabdus alkalitolerans]|uniref:sulfite exporter TauE/SafE family protein n=1 Tax=Thalassorhabdus alkalitolerans TaxID=2282697 RepID=UPI0036D7F937